MRWFEGSMRPMDGDKMENVTVYHNSSGGRARLAQARGLTWLQRNGKTETMYLNAGSIMPSKTYDIENYAVVTDKTRPRLFPGTSLTREK